MAKQSPHDADEIAPGTVVDGRYRIVRSIGQGGNGMVYEVEHARTGRRLALKALLDETGFARLEQEARAASLMKNGHTARIIDMEAGGPTGAYMVMELLEGQSLRALLDDAGQLPLELTVNIAMQVCECLHEAHGLGIIHRDLKPENVFLCPSPWPGQYDVKVLDFGVMKIAESGGAIPKSSLTRTGSTVGTPYYMSLEQLRNSSAVDARADVYSLGVVLYECLSGRKPFQADTIGDLVYALCSGPPAQLSRVRPDLPAEVSATVMRTLGANRDDRPASMLDLALSLLPHATPAFALWVRVDGKQPALSRAAAPPVTMGGSPPYPAAQPGGPPYPPAQPVSTPFPRPVEPGPGAPPRPAPKAAVPTLTLHASPAVLGVPRPAARVPEAEAAMPERRDTPTEMYVKGVHGPVGDPSDADETGEPTAAIVAPVLDEEGRGGDRDTPTRAIAFEAIQRSPMVTTLKSPAGEVDGEQDVPEAPTFNLRDGASLIPPTREPITMGETPKPPPRAIRPGASTAKLTIPLGDFLQGVSPPAQGLGPAGLDVNAGAAGLDVPASAGPPKPRWQQGIDRALIRIGHAVEGRAQRFRAAPQNTQIIVVIVAGTLAILVIGFVLFLAMH